MEKLNKMELLNDVPVMVMAATKDSYRISYPDGTMAIIPARSVNPLREKLLTFSTTQTLFDRPDTTAAQMVQIKAGSRCMLRGAYRHFELVSYNNLTGWINVR